MIRRGWRTSGLAAVTVLALVSGGAGAAAADSHDATIYNLVARHSSKCADVISASTADGAEVGQYDCGSGLNQQWQLRDAGNGYVQIVAQHSGKCLDVAGRSTADGARVLQWSCHSGTNQQFQAQDAGSGYVRLVARHSGKCLDVASASTANGARLQQWACHTGTNQQWRQNPLTGSDSAGYLFAYFTGEGTSNGEQVYFALSQGNNPLSYRALNGGRPVVVSTQGERGVRDPYLVRAPQGNKFYLIATDLRIYGNHDWDRASRHGSRSIMVWESTNLVNWSAGRLVRVSPPEAGNTWAPEAYWDASQNAFVVFWASKLYKNADHSDNTYHRMMYATTTDFITFSSPRVWVDAGYSTIDSTVTSHQGVYYRYTKDERSNSGSNPCGKFITSHTSTWLTNTNWSFQTQCIGSGAISHGEGPLVFKSNTEERWYMFIDEYGGRGYVPFTTTNLAGGQWTAVSGYTLPGRPRHGSVLPVTATEYQALLNTFG